MKERIHRLGPCPAPERRQPYGPPLDHGLYTLEHKHTPQPDHPTTDTEKRGHNTISDKGHMFSIPMLSKPVRA